MKSDVNFGILQVKKNILIEKNLDNEKKIIKEQNEKNLRTFFKEITRFYEQYKINIDLLTSEYFSESNDLY